MNRYVFRSAAFVLASALAAGCSDGSSGEAPSTSPTLEELTLDKSAIKANALETIKVSFSYSDPDGDVGKLFMKLEAPGIVSEDPKNVPFDSNNLKTGQQEFALQLNVPIKVTVTATFWLADAKGQESPKVTRTIEAQ